MFHQSDLVALPSRTEGFGLVALEAISSGVPILVSGESGVAEALQKVEGGNSVIVESDDDAVEWARRISEVSNQSPKEREAKARQLRENYRKVYSWGEQCEMFKGLIENVVKTANDGKSNIKVDVEHMKLADHDTSSTPSVSTMEPAGCQMASTPPGTNRKRQSDTDLEDLQPFEKKVLCRIAMNYLDTIPPQSRDEHNEFQEYLQKMKVLITGVSVGSLVITVKCDSLKSLEQLWEDYSCGLLEKMVQECFVTEKILKELNLAELKLKTTMDIEEYKVCKVYFEKDALRGALSFEFHPISSTSESSQKQVDLKKWKQKTKIEETVEMKDTSSLTVIPTTGQGKELGESTGNIEKWEDTSLLTILSTTGHGKELEGRLKSMKLKEEKGILPLSGSSIFDPVEKLEDLQRMKGSLPSSPLSTFDLEEKLAEVYVKLRRPRKKQGRKVDRLSPFEGSSFSVALSTASHKEELEGEEKTMNLLEKKDSLPSSTLSTTDLEEKLEEVCVKLMVLRKEALENTIRSGLVKFDVSLPKELQSYVSYLFNESAKLGLRKRGI
ncbi:uncharacterized protein LOC111341951 [Stylophora pistillata]|uniref:uncharacterized protein LOC111341951 n=1 Tax=Stylophora pistillata TaxID=50429 RepID=UPI000C049278|nr:uncharacterized protein LOC111341951 [Stylophora pistillata]